MLLHMRTTNVLQYGDQDLSVSAPISFPWHSMLDPDYQCIAVATVASCNEIILLLHTLHIAACSVIVSE